VTPDAARNDSLASVSTKRTALTVACFPPTAHGDRNPGTQSAARKSDGLDVSCKKILLNWFRCIF
jgi:hypothetical protein